MIIIRESKEEDIPAIAKVAVSCFPQDYIDDDGIKYAEAWVKERLSMNTFARYHVAENDGKIVGFVYHLMIGGLSGVVQLEQIGVDPNHRQKGIGVKLILESETFWKKYLLKEFKKPLYKMLLTTSKINNVAHNLYAKCGFKYETTMRKLYFGNDEEIWVKEF
jgi:GNAT superfamily N-acetyltransferase